MYCASIVPTIVLVKSKVSVYDIAKPTITPNINVITKDLMMSLITDIYR